ncbi:hypothetical protein CN918_27380 [Priestia megaterium]|nr:hypothetical protein CN918_27380 [Priestia megaterium]
MRKLILMRGVPGCGKSTYLSSKGLEPYVLSPDTLRLLFQSPTLNENGSTSISGRNDKKVWRFLHEILESRMQRGDFTIIDATHTKTRDFSQYKQLADSYRYHVLCIDFSDVPLEQALKWNLQRPIYKQVPSSVIERMHQNLQESSLPSWVDTYTPDSFDLSSLAFPSDFSSYEKIHIIGDLHGCYDTLQNYMPKTLPQNELFIFVGDYVDRGIQNADTLTYLFELMYKPNVILLEGNHEIHLWRFANNLPSYSKKEFERYTKKELEEAGISKKKVRAFYRHLRQMVYFTYHGKEVLVTHGGLPSITSPLVYTQTEQLIKGVGDYGTDIDNLFTAHSQPHQYQVHGHRNIQNYPVQASERSFNLEGKVEMGGHLRIVTLDKEGFKPHEVKNYTVSPRFTFKPDTSAFQNEPFIEKLRNDPLIYEKKLGNNVSSFNFKREVFDNALWTAQNAKARGLFINTKTTEIVARSYDKFFSIESYLNNKSGKLF